MKRELSVRFYRALGLCAMVLTLMAALTTVFDHSNWIAVAFGYASALAIAWMQRNPIDANPTRPSASGRDEGERNG